MTIDSDSDKETGGATKPQKKPQKGKKAQPQAPIAPEEEDIIVNKDFNLEDIIGSGGPSNKKTDGKVQVIDGKYENKMLWSYSEAVKTEKGA